MSQALECRRECKEAAFHGFGLSYSEHLQRVAGLRNLYVCLTFAQPRERLLLDREIRYPST